MCRISGFVFKQNVTLCIFGGIMCTQVSANGVLKHETDAIDIGATLMFQKEEYRGVLTDSGSSQSASFLRKAKVKVKIPLYRKTVFKLKFNKHKSDDVTVTDAFVKSGLIPGFSLKAGRFDPEFGLELTGSGSWTTAIERSSIYDLLLLSGDGANGEGLSLSYSADSFHGNFSAYHIPNTVFYSSRLVYMPIHKNAHRLLFGYSVTYTGDLVSNDGEIKSELGFWSLGDDSDTNPIKLAKRVDDEAISDNREMGLEVAYQYQNALFQAEYVRRDYASQDSRINTLAEGYSLQLAYTLTGESRRFKNSNATYKGIKPKHRHGPVPGAWEIFLRHDDLKVNQESYASSNDLSSEVRRADVNTLGINWYYREDLRISTSYSRVFAPADDNDEGQTRGSGMALRMLFTF
jgi:phosphate-selective porin OprO/OprP